MKTKILLLKGAVIVFLLHACSGPRQLSELNSDNGIWSYKNQPYTGMAIEYYPDKSKKAEYNIIRGSKSGEFKIWHPNGQLRTTGNIYQYSKSNNQYLLHGSLRVFDYDGKQILEKNYNHGQVVPFFNPIKSPHSGKIWMDRNPGSAPLKSDLNDSFNWITIYFSRKPIDSQEDKTNSCNWKGHSTNEKWDLLADGEILPINIAENSSICPPGYRIPFPGEFEEELKGMKSDTKFDLHLIPAGKWDSKNNKIVDNAVGYFWVKSDMGYTIARISESGINYGLADDQFYYPVRCLFTPTSFSNLRRQIIKYGPTTQINSQYGQLNGTITIYLCIDRSGRIIFKEINQEETTIRNPEVQKSALEIMNQFLFAVDDSAPEVECGDYTIRFR
ncbi:MAG: hypothetical protein EA362_13850 [Saprospirales bacterium]|nr:MAG: hypothetical protein EA362_13850 [Saprospirales bacterium]